MDKEIVKLCKQIEKENNVKIIFAIENGSRAWRMDSKDSDYDVRFVYKREKDDYLTLTKEKDVINLDKGLIDMSGFDIFKYLELLSGSNPTTIEWLMSDIVYYGKQPKELRDYAIKHFSEKALYYHYKSMCKNNYIKYIKSGDLVTYKKYLYALRGLTNALYVKKNKTLPPIIFIKAIKVLPIFL
ncbi:nucleotidyltransferase domain-containing protein, partial [Candidatus Woesearchaeota archaeon]|nr:nucleotidyltransferase domain-containing protein [Candidatus Woesearchaeota archaeon]